MNNLGFAHRAVDCGSDAEEWDGWCWCLHYGNNRKKSVVIYRTAHAVVWTIITGAIVFFGAIFGEIVGWWRFLSERS